MIVITTIILLWLAVSSGCQSKQIKPTSEPTWGPQGEVNPLTLLSYIEEVNLDETRRIEFTHPQTKKQVIITDQTTIQAVVVLLRSSSESCDANLKRMEMSLLVVMLIPNNKEENTVSVDFHSDENEVAMDSVATGSWPIKFQGTYSVCSDFGKKLFQLLGLESS